LLVRRTSRNLHRDAGHATVRSPTLVKPGPSSSGRHSSIRGLTTLPPAVAAHNTVVADAPLFVAPHTRWWEMFRFRRATFCSATNTLLLAARLSSEPYHSRSVPVLKWPTKLPNLCNYWQSGQLGRFEKRVASVHVFLVFLGPTANAGMVPVFPFPVATTYFPCSPPYNKCWDGSRFSFPSCHYMLPI
jgi:hypothetical protein